MVRLPAEASIRERLRANHSAVLAAVQSKVDWSRSGKKGAAECFVHAQHGEGGIVGIMARLKIQALTLTLEP